MSEPTQDISRFPQLFAQLTDPRDPRGVRHPYSALCSLVFLALLRRCLLNNFALLLLSGFDLFTGDYRRCHLFATYLNEQLGLTGCQIAIRLDYLELSDSREVLKYERRYFVTSLNPSEVSPATLLHLIRSHWQVENSLHFIKDRWWDEDRHWTRRPGLAATFASLTNAALSAERFLPQQSGIMRAQAEQVQWNPAKTLAILVFSRWHTQILITAEYRLHSVCCAQRNNRRNGGTLVP